jgi:hypothetical protein
MFARGCVYVQTDVFICSHSCLPARDSASVHTKLHGCQARVWLAKFPASMLIDSQLGIIHTSSFFSAFRNVSSFGRLHAKVTF